jgi:tRNA (guanine-N7-)-methyltransferase
MKPKDLKFPFRFEARAPLLSDGVLYVPKYYQEHSLWPQDGLKTILSSFSSISLEYCSGNGTWIIEKAKSDPSTLWIAVEKRFDRVQKIWSKKHNYSLDNLLIICGDAMTFTEHYLPEKVVDKIFVNFPDPWPKDKHAKHRLFQNPFIQQMARVAKDQGEAVLVTDDENYSDQMVSSMTSEGLWRSAYIDPFYRTEWPNYGSSFFEELWKHKGKTIRYMQFFR